MIASADSRLHSVKDWRVNLVDPALSVVFPGQRPVEGPLREHAEQLAQLVRHHLGLYPQAESFTLEHAGCRYRFQRIRDRLFGARVVQEQPRRVDQLGFRPAIADALLSEDLRKRGGLVVIFGGSGAGKTTTMAATVLSRLEKWGGYCLCVEDPPEYRLEGFHGSAGYCEQVDATERGYERVLQDAMRCFPSGQRSLLMMGEIRSATAAYQLVQIALNGHLVLTTMHAKDIVSGLVRLISLAGQAGEGDIRAMLAESLVLALHQHMEQDTLQTQMLKFNQASSSLVQNGSLHLLHNEIALQNKALDRRGVGSLR